MDASRGPAAEAPTQPGASSGEAESFEAETKRGRPSRVERRNRRNKGPGSFLRELPVTSTNKVQKAKLADFALNPAESFDLRDRKRRK